MTGPLCVQVMASPAPSTDSMEVLQEDDTPSNDTETAANIPTDENKMSMKPSPGLPRARFDVSLFYLTRKFMDIIKSSPKGIVRLNEIAKQLRVGKRRVYDITNALEGIQLIQKKSKNVVQWIGEDLNLEMSPQQKLQNEISDLSAMEEALDELILDCARKLFRLTDDRVNKKFAYVTYQDIHRIEDYHEQIVIAVKAPEETKLEVPTPREDCIEIHLKSNKGPIDVFLCGVEQENPKKSFQKLTKALKMDPEPIVIDDDDDDAAAAAADDAAAAAADDAVAAAAADDDDDYGGGDDDDSDYDEPPDNANEKRKSYSIEFKKRIVENSRGTNLTAFCKEKGLRMRMVQKWRTEYENFSQQVCKGNAKKRKCGSGRQPLFLELEDMICEWIVDRRAKALVVRRADIKEFALAMAPQLGISAKEFKASKHWLDRFLLRYELSLRSSTTLLKLDDVEVIKRALAFKDFVDAIDFSKYQLSNMIAMDETSVFMDQGYQTTIDQRGASSVYVPSTGYESARITCILAICLDGSKTPPLIISKGDKERIEQVSGIYVLETEKAWCTEAVLRKWVKLMLPLALRGSQRGLLVWDSASTHRTKNMKNFLHEKQIDQIMIPAGITALLQSLDIAINKPFKDHLRTEINDYIENRMERNQPGNFVKPGLKEIVTWVRNSWEKITDRCVANALQAGYLDERCPFKDSAIARHEKWGPMVLKEIELREVYDGSPSLDRYDDVPEDDDMTVFE